MSDQNELTAEQRKQLALAAIHDCLNDINKFCDSHDFASAAPAAALTIMFTSLTFLAASGNAPSSSELILIVHNIMLQEFNTMIPNAGDPLLQQANLTDN